MLLSLRVRAQALSRQRNHFARNIVDPPCWRQYESDMLSIRNLDGAPDRGAQDPFHGQAQRFDG